MSISYYRDLVLAMLQPGAISRASGTVIGAIAAGVGRVLNEASGVTDTLKLQVFPHTATESLDEWEQLFGFPPGSDATIAQRQAALVGRWRAPMGYSPVAIRAAVADAVNSHTAFWDRCADEDVSFRYEQVLPTDCTISESATGLVLNSARNDYAAHYGDPAMCLLPIVDRTDDYSISVELVASSLSDANSFAGLVAWESSTSAIFYGLYYDGGTIKIGLAKVEDGVYTAPTGGVAYPGHPYWLQLSRTAGTWYAKYGSVEPGDISTFTTITSTTIKPRKIGLATWNYGPDVLYSELTAGTVKVSYAKPENNVELVEIPTTETITSDAKYMAFIHRDPLEVDTVNGYYHSQTINNWTKYGCSVPAGSIDCTTAPDGTTTADGVVCTAINEVHRLRATVVAVNGQRVVWSVYAKKANSNKIMLWNTQDANCWARFDLDTGTVGTVGSSALGYGIEEVEEQPGWYRCYISFIAGSSVAAYVYIMSPAWASSWIGHGTANEIYLWGAQIEKGTTPSAYLRVPATTAITRYTTYDLATARRICDRIKPAHVYIGVGDSDSFTWNTDKWDQAIFSK